MVVGRYPAFKGFLPHPCIYTHRLVVKHCHTLHGIETLFAYISLPSYWMPLPKRGFHHTHHAVELHIEETVCHNVVRSLKNEVFAIRVVSKTRYCQPVTRLIDAVGKLHWSIFSTKHIDLCRQVPYPVIEHSLNSSLHHTGCAGHAGGTCHLACHNIQAYTFTCVIGIIPHHAISFHKPQGRRHHTSQ